jgi:hypothetical protein
MQKANFTRGGHPLDTLCIGLTVEAKDWLTKHDIIPSKIEREKVEGKTIFNIDVDGDVWLEGYHINDVTTKIPDCIKFRNVKGKFVLTNNM